MKGFKKTFENIFKRKGQGKYELEWTDDCNGKKDYDGVILSISSRFYPPCAKYGWTWDGNVDVMIGDLKVSSKSFDCGTLEELKKSVESYVETISKKIESALSTIDFEDKPSTETYVVQ